MKLQYITSAIVKNTITVTKDQLLELIREKLGLPENVNVYMKVPGGGDWSNTRLRLGGEQDLYIEWSTPLNQTNEVDLDASRIADYTKDE